MGWISFPTCGKAKNLQHTSSKLKNAVKKSVQVDLWKIIKFCLGNKNTGIS